MHPDRGPERGRTAGRRAADPGIRPGGQGRHDPARHLPGRLHVPAGDRHHQPGLPGGRPENEGDRRQPGHARSGRGVPAHPRPPSGHPAPGRVAPRGSAGDPAGRGPGGGPEQPRPGLHHPLGRQGDGRQDPGANLLSPAHVLRDPVPAPGHHGAGLQGPGPPVRLRGLPGPHLGRGHRRRPAVHPREGPPVAQEGTVPTARGWPSSAPTTPRRSP